MMNSLQELLKRLRAPPPLRPPLHPPDVTHVMNCTRPSAFFAALPRFSPPFRIRVLLSTETEEQKKQGRPGNEASMAVPGLGCLIRAGWAVLSINGPRQQFPHVPLFKAITFNSNNWDEPE